MTSSDSNDIVRSDAGHRYGNFHNYYNFNPSKNRLSVLQRCGFLDYIFQRLGQKTSVYYCDLGCNEGDLSLEMSQLLASFYTESSDMRRHVQMVGLDIDPELITRAQSKFHRRTESNISNGVFHVCNLLDEQDHMSRCQSFLNEKSSSTQSRFDLMSIFSTTMWLHIHAGDEGLKQFIKRCCDLSDMILIEPQPSKCYKDINVRLRKMNRPEVDVSTKRLKLRGNIGDEIERIMVNNGFERVNIKMSSTEPSMPTTEWNRTLYLYVRSNADVKQDI